MNHTSPPPSHNIHGIWIGLFNIQKYTVTLLFLFLSKLVWACYQILVSNNHRMLYLKLSNHFLDLNLLTGHFTRWEWDSVVCASVCQTSDCVCFWLRSGEDTETRSGGAHLRSALQLRPRQPVPHPAETHAHASHERLLFLPGEPRVCERMCVIEEEWVGIMRFKLKLIMTFQSINKWVGSAWFGSDTL